MARKTRKDGPDRFEAITNQIIASLEKGVAPWVCPWEGSGIGSLPRNGLTGRAYSGLNIFMCWGSGHPDPRWYTFNQVQTINGYKRSGRFWNWAGEGEEPEGKFGVRKGQKGTKIVHWHKVVKEAKDDEEKDRSFMSLKVWTVFNHLQVNWVDGREPGADQVETVTVDPAQAHQVAADLFEALSAQVYHGGGVAAYSPKTDVIQMPPAKAFKTVEHYWATRAHETVHWTGHKSRCKRLHDINRFGSEAYAFEELVAELGAAFLCAELGITGKLQHTEYIGHWVKVLKNDKHAIFTAASLAKAALEYINEHKGVETIAKAVAA